MVMKVYKLTKPGNLSTIIKDVRISFDGMMHTPGTYSTSNEELQKAIEGSPNYGKVFMLAFSSGEPEPAVTPPPVETPEPETEPEPAAEKPKPVGRPKGAKSSGQQEQPAV
jgi:hypothetical protein